MPWHGFSKEVNDFINDWNVEMLAVAPLLMLVLFFVAHSFDPNTTSAMLSWLVVLSPIWLPLFLLA